MDAERRNRGGRPRKAEARTAQIMVRLTPSERAELMARAGERGAAEYLRAQGLGRAPRLPRQVPAVNREAWEDLARALGNLNQVAHRLNSGERVLSAEILAAVDATRTEVVRLRLTLLGDSDGDLP
jgi:hypothetical protein